jgi:hypothetical protein
MACLPDLDDKILDFKLLSYAVKLLGNGEDILPTGNIVAKRQIVIDSLQRQPHLIPSFPYVFHYRRGK